MGQYNARQRKPLLSQRTKDLIFGWIIAIVIIGLIALAIRVAINEEKYWVVRENRKDQIEENRLQKERDNAAKIKAAQDKKAAEDYEVFLGQSHDAGSDWAKKYGVDSTRCDGRIGTEALKAEGWDAKNWLAGCLESATDRKPS